MSNNKFGGTTSRRGNPSLFGPIVLIAIGVYFLLRNLGMLPETVTWNWTAVLQLWPLWLIFLGVNVLVRQAPRPLGGFLSAVVGLTAVGLAGYVLLLSEDNPFLARLGIQSAPEVKLEALNYAPDDVNRAQIEIDLSWFATELSALQDSRSLIEAQIAHAGSYEFVTEQEGSAATVQLRAGNEGSSWLWFINPGNWGDPSGAKWQIGLNPRVLTDLRLNVSAGSADLNLRDLTLSSLTVRGGAGRLNLYLADGDYETTLDASAGAIEVWLAKNGRQRIEVDGSAGSMTFYLPEGVEAVVRVRDGAGSFTIDESRFTQISGKKFNSGVWQTAAYREGAANSVELLIDVGAGSVRVTGN